MEKLMNDQLDRKSIHYHRWISADEYGWKFGVAVQDVNKIVFWLGAHGFEVKSVSRSRMRIDFSGTAGEVREAFHTEIHRLQVHGEDHIANMSDPQIPAALAPAVAGIAWLNDFRPKPQYTGPTPGSCEPYDANGNATSTCYWVVPHDLWTIYNFPVSSYNGAGQTIAVMEDALPWHDDDTDWCAFRTRFLESTCSQSLFQIVTPNCLSPSITSSGEVALDPQWASAAAPGATVIVATCKDGTTPGYLTALENYVDGNYSPAIISMSYGFCEASLGLSGMSMLNQTYQEAAARGFSVFVAAGDGGAAGCDQWGSGPAVQGLAVSGYASSPYVVAVGGTTFADWALGNPIPSPYWSSQNDGTYWNSALSYIPEIPWNSSCGNVLTAEYYGYDQTPTEFCNSNYHPEQFLKNTSGSGGQSTCAIPIPAGGCAGYPKPSWQSGILGNQSDGVRDVPDVSIFAGGVEWGHELVYCSTFLHNPACTIDTMTWNASSGTSFSAPIFAGIQALIGQNIAGHGGNPNVGNPTPTYYAFAKSEYGQSGNLNCLSAHAMTGNSCIFYDISYLNSPGDSTNVVPCEKNSNNKAINCYLDGENIGVLSTQNSRYAPAYAIQSQFGWDFTSGIGSPNVTNLVNAWPVP